MGDHELNSISCDRILQDSSRGASREHVKRRHSRVFILTGFFFVLGVSCLVAGVVLIALSQTQRSATKCTTTTTTDEKGTCNKTCSGSKNDTQTENSCTFSSEAKLAGKSIICIGLQMSIKSMTNVNTEPFEIFAIFFYELNC